jgi:hypothetical protein
MHTTPSHLLTILLLLGCAGSRQPEPALSASDDTTRMADEEGMVCVRQADVTVHVDNRSSMSVQIAFGSYAPKRAALGLAQTTYSVPRYYLESAVRLRIVGGGLALNTPPPIPTEPVDCNDAMLIIGPRPRYSFFYGGLVYARPREPPTSDPERPDTTTSTS